MENINSNGHTITDDVWNRIKESMKGLLRDEHPWKTSEIEDDPFNIYKDKKLLHISEKNIYIQNNEIYFKNRKINYNRQDKAGRIKGSPSYTEGLFTCVEKLLKKPPINNELAEAWNDFKYEQRKKEIGGEVYYQLGDKSNMEEVAKSLILIAKIKILYGETKFVNEEFEISTYENNPIQKTLAALQTKPFLILAGVSGTGKTQIARLVAGVLTSQDNNKEV